MDKFKMQLTVIIKKNIYIHIYIYSELHISYSSRAKMEKRSI